MKTLLLILAILMLASTGFSQSPAEEWALILDADGQISHFFQMSPTDLKHDLTPEMELIYKNGVVISLTTVIGTDVTVTSATLYRGTEEECLAKIDELGLELPEGIWE